MVRDWPPIWGIKILIPSIDMGYCWMLVIGLGCRNNKKSVSVAEAWTPFLDGKLHFTTFNNYTSQLRSISLPSSYILYFTHNQQALPQYTPEHHVLIIQPRAFRARDEELKNRQTLLSRSCQLFRTNKYPSSMQRPNSCSSNDHIVPGSHSSLDHC